MGARDTPSAQPEVVLVCRDITSCQPVTSLSHHQPPTHATVQTLSTLTPAWSERLGGCPAKISMMSSGVSFGFSKTKSKQSSLIKAPAAESFTTDGGAKEDGQREFLSDASQVVEIKKKVQAELVIPCRGNRVQLKAKVQRGGEEERPEASDAKKGDEKGEEDLNSAAVKEILQESERWREERDAEGEEEERRRDFQVPLVSEEAEEEERTKESSLEDYETVPVQGFGMGMLRGMGYKAGEGIGGFKKLDVKCLDPVLRPKGLGLGAVRPGQKDGGGEKKGKEEEKDLVLKKGAYVKVLSGVHRDLYGEVDGLDEDAARVFIKLAVGGKAASVSENAVRTVTSKEYKKYSKVINRDLYDEYDERQRSRQAEWDLTRRDRDKDVQQDGKKRAKKRSRSRSPRSNGAPASKQKSSSYSSPSGSRLEEWVRPHLRVRFIDQKYKKGRYYKSKMVVEDVLTPEQCSCRSEEDSSFLEDVCPEQLETVIPKKEGSVVMVLRGRWRGRLGEMVKRDKAKCLAVVQMLPDRDEVARLDFDDICEYIGDVPDY